jgi:hypothetical protein
MTDDERQALSIRLAREQRERQKLPPTIEDERFYRRLARDLRTRTQPADAQADSGSDHG